MSGQEETSRTRLETEATVEAARIAADAQGHTDDSNSEVVIAQADAELTWQLQQSTDTLEGIQINADTDLAIAKMEYEVKLKEAENDASRISQVEMVNAQANLISAENEGLEWEAKEAKWELQYAPDIDTSSSAYTYDVA